MSSVQDERREAFAKMNPTEERDNICDICKQQKREDEFILHQSPLGPVRGNICSECMRELGNERKMRYYHSHREEYAERSREWRKKNPDKVRAQHKQYARQHPEKVREIERRYRQKRKERGKEDV
jgi:transketolase